ncbi:MAG TPA: hypothetical protein VNN20_01860 [Thermodesulfobacteriota bacterium]|nr:hypothetical protein [Thermodesulfobacteriota bacterium]
MAVTLHFNVFHALPPLPTVYSVTQVPVLTNDYPLSATREASRGLDESQWFDGVYAEIAEALTMKAELKLTPTL